jgi:hypothetical protein
MLQPMQEEILEATKAEMARQGQQKAVEEAALILAKAEMAR